MSGWALATELAIWTLIGGSLLVFGWFLVELVRLRGGPPAPGDEPPPDPPQ